MAMGMGMGLGLNNRGGGGSCSSGGGNNNVSIVWFRRDLRVEDNPALTAGVRAGAVVALYVWSPEEEGQYYPGRVSRWWLKQSLRHLDSSLRSLGVPLLTKRSLHSSLSALLHVIQSTRATHLFFNHLYDPISLVRDHRIKQELSAQGIVVRSFNGDLLYEPWEINNEQGRPFTTFQAYWNKLLNMPYDPAAPLLPPKRIISGNVGECVSEELGLEDESEKGSNALLARAWVPGWSSADKALTAFINGPLMEYAANRRKADSATTSLLSPHLHFGELSVRKVFHLARMKQVYWANDGNAGGEESVNLFLRAIGLRDYSRYLSFHFPDSHERPLLAHLNVFPWSDDAQLFKAWRQGRTGYPLVDAGMRELWATGWLHDRIRVVVSSFFVKVLQLPWRWGMKYFWDTLLDADLECDALGWQYISGCLPDGRHLHRIDDPQLQGYNFDPAGEYVRRWLPELARLPTEWIHHPWDAPHVVLRAAGVELGSNYPLPVVELPAATRRLQHGLCLMWQRHAAATPANLEGQGESPGQEQQQQQHHVGEAINMEVDGLNTTNNNNVVAGGIIRTNADSTRRRQDQLVPSISINSSEQVLLPPLQWRNHGHDSNFSEHELSSSLDQAQAEVPMVMPMAVHMQLGRVSGSSNHVMDNIEEQEEVQQQQNHYYSESNNYSAAYSSSSSAVGGGRRRRGREAAAAADVSVPVWTTSQGFQEDSSAATNSESHSSQLQQNHSIASWRQRHASNQGNFSVMLDQGAGS